MSHINKNFHSYVTFVIISLFVVFGAYIMMREYITVKEQNEIIDIVVPFNRDLVGEEYIARHLINEWLKYFTKRRYVSVLDEYQIHNLNISNETGEDFIVAASLSVKPRYKNAEWGNDTDGDGWIAVSYTFKVAKIRDQYRLTIIE